MAHKTYCKSCQRLVAPNLRGKCPYCDAELGPQVDAAWLRAPNQVAVRLSEDDFNTFLQQGLNVPEGSQAVLLKGGAVEELLGPGRHVIATMGERVKNFFQQRSVQVMLIDDADIELRLKLGQSDESMPAGAGASRRVLTADDVNVAVDCSLAVTIDRPALLVAQAMGGRHELTREELTDACRDETTAILQSLLRARALEELHGNETLRRDVERGIESSLGPWLDNRGLRLVKLNFLGFFSEALEKIRAQRAKLWELNAQEAVAARYDEIKKNRLTRETLGELFERRTRQQKLEILNQLDEKQLLSDQNLAIVKRTIFEEQEDYDLARDFFKNKMSLLNDNELDLVIQNHRVEIARIDETEKDIRAGSELDRDRKEWDFALQIKRQKSELELWEDEQRRRIAREHTIALDKHRVEMIEKMAAVGPEAMLAYTDDAGKAKLIAELRRAEILKGYSEDQILAMAAENSAPVAEAIKEKFRSLGSARIEDLYKKMLEDKTGFAQQLQAMFDKALDAQSGAAVGVAHGAGPKNCGYTGMPGELKPSGAALLCAKCNTSNPPYLNFCGNCGNKLRG